MSGYVFKDLKDVSLTGMPKVKPLNVKTCRKRPVAESSFRSRSAKRFKISEQSCLKRTGVMLDDKQPKALRGPTALGPILKGRFLHLHASA